MTCQHCLPYGNPGTVPVVVPHVPRTPEEMAVPAHLRPPVAVIWVSCGCAGGVASCCDAAGSEGAE
jgi:hypothetical protein